MSVGLVLVSHSRPLAAAVAELAREMTGPDLRLALAAGVEDDPDALGTDATRVLAAIEEVAGEDGVLVLMDLGSAVMSAEMAMDLLMVDTRVVLSDAPLVEGAVAAAVQAAAGADLDSVAAEARSGLDAKRLHLGIEPGEPSAGAPSPTSTDEPADEPSDGDAEVAEHVRVPNRLGLHARPAARIVGLLRDRDAALTVENTTTGRGPVPATSLNALIVLGAVGGHDLVFRASGPDADDVLAAVRALAADNFGDPHDDVAPDEDTPSAGTAGGDAGASPVSAATDVPADSSDTLRGLVAAPGLAVGPVTRLDAGGTARMPALDDPQEAAADGSAADPDEERARLDDAVAGAARELRATREDLVRRAGEDAAAMLDAQVLVLEDPSLRADADALLTEERLPATTAWRRAIGAVLEAYESVDDPYLAERAVDVHAVGVDVLRRLRGTPPATVDPEGVLVALDLGPAQTAGLDPERVVALVTAAGSPTSHAALIARALGIPAVVAVGDDVLRIDDGTVVVVDGAAGVVELAPDADRRDEVAQAIVADERRRAQLRVAAAGPAATSDGTRILVEANVGSLADARRAVAEGADGIGLLRTELLFLDRSEAPDEDEQVALVSGICEAMEDRPVVLRTLDAGGDKPMPYLGLPREDNPFLGLRGLRIGLAHPELLRTQLRSVLRVAATHPLRLLLPMVATPGEVVAAREHLEAARASLAADGVEVPDQLLVGAMVEVPAIAVTADHLVEVVDFVSVGTNDLTQYTLAAERGNPAVAHLADPLTPAVLRLVDRVCRAATPREVPVAVCGDVARDPLAVPLLVGLGVRELSVPGVDVPRVKQVVRRLASTTAAELAADALLAPDAAAVRELVRTRLPELVDDARPTG